MTNPPSGQGGGGECQGWDELQTTIERRFYVPADAPAKLVENIEEYSAFVEMQSKMMGPSAWYQRLC